MKEIVEDSSLFITLNQS